MESGLDSLNLWVCERIVLLRRRLSLLETSVDIDTSPAILVPLAIPSLLSLIFCINPSILLSLLSSPYLFYSILSALYCSHIILLTSNV